MDVDDYAAGIRLRKTQLSHGMKLGHKSTESGPTPRRSKVGICGSADAGDDLADLEIHALTLLEVADLLVS